MEVINKVNPIKITDKDTGRVYILDFTRDTVSSCEQTGFSWDEFPKMIATYTPVIWFFAFKAHDRRISKAETDKILDQLGGLTGDMIARLRDLWNQALAPLVNTDDEDDETVKNAKWTVELD